MLKAELKDFTFKSRHIGPTNEDEALMLQLLGFENSEEFISSVIPNEIFDAAFKFSSFIFSLISAGPQVILIDNSEWIYINCHAFVVFVLVTIMFYPKNKYRCLTNLRGVVF